MKNAAAGALLILLGVLIGFGWSTLRPVPPPVPPSPTPSPVPTPTPKPDLVKVPLSLSYSQGKCMAAFTNAAQKEADLVTVDKDQSGVLWVVDNPTNGGCSSGKWELQISPVEPPERECPEVSMGKKRKKHKLPNVCKRQVDVPEHLGPGESRDFDCRLAKNNPNLDGCYAYAVKVCAGSACETADPEVDFRRK